MIRNSQSRITRVRRETRRRIRRMRTGMCIRKKRKTTRSKSKGGARG